MVNEPLKDSTEGGISAAVGVLPAEFGVGRALLGGPSLALPMTLDTFSETRCNVVGASSPDKGGPSR